MSTTTNITAAEAATRLGAGVRTIHRIAAREGIGTRHGRALLFVESDIPRLQAAYQGGPGNPKFVPGNDLWRKARHVKKSRK